MDPDLMGIGQHCAVEHCQQLDFLPFKCDCCSATFCLEHRTYASHACPKAGSKQLDIIVCPLCASGVRLQPGEDPNLAFERHTAGGCDPSNYKKVHQKPRCCASGCKEKLTSINTYTCKSCGRKVCLRHRMGEDHQCAEARAAMQRAAAAASTAGSLGAAASRIWGSITRPAAATPAAATAAPRPTPAAAAAARRAASAAQYGDPANSVRGTAERRKAAQVAAAPAPAPPPAAAAAAPPREVCPQCGAGFADVADLIRHVDREHTSSSRGSSGGGGRPPAGVQYTYHNNSNQQQPASQQGGAARAQQQQQQLPRPPPQQRGSGGGGGGRGEQFACHRCGALFVDAVALVEHDGRCGAGGSSSACVLS